MFPSLPNSTTNRCFKPERRCRELVQRWHEHCRCCCQRWGNAWCKGKRQRVHSGVKMINPCATQVRIPPYLSAWRATSAPESRNKPVAVATALQSTWVQSRHRSSAGIAALPWFENSSEIRAVPRGARPWDPDLPKITHSPPHAGARHTQPRHTRSARPQGAEEINPQLPRD